jgi:hypothetical protein
MAGVGVGGELTISLAPSLNHRMEFRLRTFGKAKVVTRVIDDHVVASAGRHVSLEKTGVRFGNEVGRYGGKFVRQDSDEAALGERNLKMRLLVPIARAEGATLLVFGSRGSSHLFAMSVGPVAPLTGHQDPVSGGGV